jgi:magnesium chelatase family protein
MVARIATVATAGLEARQVDVQVQVAQGLASFTVVGLPDKAVRESRDRVTSAFAAIGLSLPPKRVTVNLAPADLEKAGSHYDLPIALGLLGALGIIDPETLATHLAVGELALDGRLASVPGVLVAALHALEQQLSLICPAGQAAEASWLVGTGPGDGVSVVGAPDLLGLVRHLRGEALLPATPPAVLRVAPFRGPDLRQVKGQEGPKRALEVAAAGGHNLLMCGPPGAGKSMLAACLPGILPELSTAEALEVALIESVAGTLEGATLRRHRPFRAPHHSASMPALVGGGARAKPGEVSLAHLGVLFLDELPEFQANVLDSLRQPLERGEVQVARAAAHVTYPARVQLIAAMNPCRCGHLDEPALACARAPRCAADYQARVSGPLLDRIDLHVDVSAVRASDLALAPSSEGSTEVKARVERVRQLQTERYRGAGIRTNAEADGEILERVATPEPEGMALLQQAANAMRLSARAWVRTLRVARTLADLDSQDEVRRPHIAEALSFRRRAPVS